MEERIKSALIGIAGRKNVSEALVDRINCSQDFSEHRHLPEGTVWPTTTEQVAAILRLAYQEKNSSHPPGGGHGGHGYGRALPGRDRPGSGADE